MTSGPHYNAVVFGRSRIYVGSQPRERKFPTSSLAYALSVPLAHQPASEVEAWLGAVYCKGLSYE